MGVMSWNFGHPPKPDTMRKWIYNVKNNISLHDGCGRPRLLSAASQAALVEHVADVVHNVSQAQYLTKFQRHQHAVYATPRSEKPVVEV